MYFSQIKKKETTSLKHFSNIFMVFFLNMGKSLRGVSYMIYLREKNTEE